MDKLSGTYTDNEIEYVYVCRVFILGVDPRSGKVKVVNGIGEEVPLQDSDVLKLLGQETWFALYRDKSTLIENISLAEYDTSRKETVRVHRKGETGQ